MINNLYHKEQDVLNEFTDLIENGSVGHLEVSVFRDNFEKLLKESKLLTSHSDRFHKKLDKANEHITKINKEVRSKNEQLEDTVEDLAKAKIGKKASTIIFGVAICLFIAEEEYLEVYVDSYVNYSYLNFTIKILTALAIKLLESRLRVFLINRAKKKVISIRKRESILSIPKIFCTPTNLVLS